MLFFGSKKWAANKMSKRSPSKHAGERMGPWIPCVAMSARQVSVLLEILGHDGYFSVTVLSMPVDPPKYFFLFSVFHCKWHILDNLALFHSSWTYRSYSVVTKDKLTYWRVGIAEQ